MDTCECGAAASAKCVACSRPVCGRHARRGGESGPWNAVETEYWGVMATSSLREIERSAVSEARKSIGDRIVCVTCMSEVENDALNECKRLNPMILREDALEEFAYAHSTAGKREYNDAERKLRIDSALERLGGMSGLNQAASRRAASRNQYQTFRGPGFISTSISGYVGWRSGPEYSDPQVYITDGSGIWWRIILTKRGRAYWKQWDMPDWTLANVIRGR
jgi:hypothetical protein